MSRLNCIAAVLLVNLVVVGCKPSGPISADAETPGVIDAAQDVEASDVTDSETDDQLHTDVDLAVGDIAPDFELEALGGASVKLSEFVGNSGPTILLFDRAHW